MKPKFSVSVTIDQDLADDIEVLKKAFPELTKAQLLRKAFEIAAKKLFDDAMEDSTWALEKTFVAVYATDDVRWVKDMSLENVKLKHPHATECYDPSDKTNY